MNDYVKFVDEAPIIVRILMFLFYAPLWHGIYRIEKGSVILGIICIIPPFSFFFWIIDIVSYVLHRKLVWLV